MYIKFGFLGSGAACLFLFKAQTQIINIVTLDLRPKSVCTVEMTMYVHWTRIIRNRKDDHA